MRPKCTLKRTTNREKKYSIVVRISNCIVSKRSRKNVIILFKNSNTKEIIPLLYQSRDANYRNIEKCNESVKLQVFTHYNDVSVNTKDFRFIKFIKTSINILYDSKIIRSQINFYLITFQRICSPPLSLNSTAHALFFYKQNVHDKTLKSLNYV